jgi:hypothetical protein
MSAIIGVATATVLLFGFNLWGAGAPDHDRYDGTKAQQIELNRDAIESKPPLQQWMPLFEPQWVPSDVPTGNRYDGQWMKLQL